MVRFGTYKRANAKRKGISCPRDESFFLVDCTFYVAQKIPRFCREMSASVVRIETRIKSIINHARQSPTKFQVVEPKTDEEFLGRLFFRLQDVHVPLNRSMPGSGTNLIAQSN